MAEGETMGEFTCIYVYGNSLLGVGRRREWSGMERSRMAGAVGSSKMTGSAEERRGEERRGGSALNAK